MAQKTKIKKDEHGLYFRADGNIFRPNPTEACWHQYLIYHDTPSSRGYRAASAEETIFTADQAVKVNHIAGTEMATVVGADGRGEYWYSHGSYLGEDLKPINSREIWCSYVAHQC